jgi:hypothetical protein
VVLLRVQTIIMQALSSGQGTGDQVHRSRNVVQPGTRAVHLVPLTQPIAGISVTHEWMFVN